MNPALSIWLDLCRVIAALAVFIGHSRFFELAPAAVGRDWHRSADDAVTAFFVISGIVIAHATQAAHAKPRSYFLARASRVYSVALPATLFALVIDHIGMGFDAKLYTANYGYDWAGLRIIFHWLFLGETWFGSSQPFSMSPYWSLGYEVWYYVLFGCLTLLTGRTRWLGAGAALLFMGPRIWLLLPTWWLGVLLYRQKDRLPMRRGPAIALMMASVLAYAAFLASGWRNATDAASQHLYAMFDRLAPVPFNPGESAHVLSDYAIAALFATFVIGCTHCGVSFGVSSARAIRTLAGYTFTFYLIHFTLLALVKALGVGEPGWAGYVAILTAILAATWALAQIGEQHRTWYRNVFSRAWPV
jgi:peptidoglycan/LPS O-acetylase OafA/YrhL